ncbi:MAG: M48 family metallopeptidase [Polaromonas sp.]
MTLVGQIEKRTQARIVALFQERLGYDYLGDQTDLDNRNIETRLLTAWLLKQGVSDSLITRALHELNKVATDTSKSIHDRNKEVYELLRYGVKVQPGMGENRVTVWLIDWQHPRNNHFAIAEEVTVSLDLFVRPGASAGQREAVLLRWYRDQLKALIPPLLDKWQPVIGVQASHWGIRKMKTRWGSCNPDARRVWFNLELAKKPVRCLEYIVVHELVHLLERNHSERFMVLMDEFMPNWRVCRETLNSGVLGHEVWGY